MSTTGVTGAGEQAIWDLTAKLRKVGDEKTLDEECNLVDGPMDETKIHGIVRKWIDAHSKELLCNPTARDRLGETLVSRTSYKSDVTRATLDYMRDHSTVVRYEDFLDDETIPDHILLGMASQLEEICALAHTDPRALELLKKCAKAQERKAQERQDSLSRMQGNMFFNAHPLQGESCKESCYFNDPAFNAHMQLSYFYAENDNAQLALHHYALVWQATFFLGIPPEPPAKLQAMIDAQYLEFADSERVSQKARSAMASKRAEWLAPDSAIHNEFSLYLFTQIPWTIFHDNCQGRASKSFQANHLNAESLASSIYNLSVALSKAEHKVLFQEKRWQEMLLDLAKLGVEKGWLLPAQYATLMCSYEWAVQRPDLFNSDAFTLMPLFNEDGSVNSEARAFIASTMKPMEISRIAGHYNPYAGRVIGGGTYIVHRKKAGEYLQESEIDELFERRRKAPQSQRFIPVIDEKKEGSGVYEQDSSHLPIDDFLSYGGGFNVFANEMKSGGAYHEVRGYEIMIPTGRTMVAPIDMVYDFIDIRYNGKGIYPKVGIGTFTDMHILEGQEQGFRWVGASHPDARLPTQADSRRVRRPTGFFLHDTFHTVSSSEVGEYLGAYMHISRFVQAHSSYNEKVNRLYDANADVDFPKFRFFYNFEPQLNTKTHALRSQVFWLELGEAVLMYKDNNERVNQILKGIVSFALSNQQWSDELGINAGSLQAAASYLRKKHQSEGLTDNEEWRRKSDPLFIMESVLIEPVEEASAVPSLVSVAEESS